MWRDDCTTIPYINALGSPKLDLQNFVSLWNEEFGTDLTPDEVKAFLVFG